MELINGDNMKQNHTNYINEFKWFAQLHMSLARVAEYV